MVTQAKALKISWVKRLGTAPYNTGSRQLVNIQFGNLASFIFKCNLASKDIKQTYFNLDSFWQEVLLYWCEYNFEDIKK